MTVNKAKPRGQSPKKRKPPTAKRAPKAADRRHDENCVLAEFLVDHSPYGICVTNLERVIVSVNPAVCTMTGYTNDELVGQPVTMIYQEDTEDSHLHIEELREAGHTMRMVSLRTKNQRTLPVQADYVYTDELNGEDVIIENYSDQTDRRKLDQLKDEFVFVAAHELRNPVTAVKLLLDIVFEDKRIMIDPILRGYLLKVQEANSRLSQLVDDLLEVSRTEVGKLKIHVTPQSITDHVVGLLGDMRPTAVAKGVTLRYAPSPDTPLVLADSMKLKEILTNLISNAIKYNVTGGSVTISHELRGHLLFTTIEDTGIGINAEDQRRLFEKFWRSEDNAVRAQTGTGLGLFIVHELVHRMGGSIDFQSSHGQGTTFTFSLPIAP
jgi:two-component system sensor histidine kinase VicK